MNPRPGRLPSAAPLRSFGVRTALRRLAAAGLLLAVLPAAWAAGPAQQSPIVVDTMAVSHTFGSQMIFAAAVHGPADITQAVLLIRPGADSRTQVIDAHFDPARQVVARVTLDLQAQPIPPFADEDPPDAP